MKLRTLALALLLAAGRLAATTLTGTILSPGGSAVTGALYLQLSNNANLLSTGGCGGPAVVSAVPGFIFNLTAGSISGPGTAPYSVPGGDCLSPVCVGRRAIG